MGEITVNSSLLDAFLCEIYLMPMNWTLKDGYAGKFCSALFYYNKKK